MAPLTLPAHSSIFTGKFPPEHGVRDNGGFFLGAGAAHARGSAQGARLPDRCVRRRLRARLEVGDRPGIRHLRRRLRPQQDAARVSLGAIQRPGNEVVDKALPWIRAVSRDAVLRLGSSLRRPLARTARPSRSRRATAAIRTTARSRSPTRRSAASSRQLQAHGAYDRTIIVVIGDHGESLGDHGESAHGFFIYDSVTRVPFVIRAPFSLAARRRVADPVRSVDVMPTVLDLLGVPPAGAVSGVSLVAADDRGTPRAGARRLLGGDVPASPLRLERPARAALGPLQGHRRAAAGALRPRAGSAGDDQPLRRACRRSAIG